MTRATVIVFARSPAIGLGKTRLARDVGAVEAWRLYRSFSAGVMRRLRSPRWRLMICLAGCRPDPLWPKLPIEDQGRGDLGLRLARAIRRHGRGPVAVVGTDIPDLKRGHLGRAFALLRTGRIVIGPAADGGFWLIAAGPDQARTLRLDEVRWSSQHTLSDVITRNGRSVSMLETLRDIDDGADLTAWRAGMRPAPIGVA